MRQVQEEGNRFTPLSDLINPRSGSDWNHAELLTFRVLLKRLEVSKSNIEHPPFLTPHLKEAKIRLGVSDGFQTLLNILREKKWNSLRRTEYRRRGKEFGGFLECLDLAVEEKVLPVAPSMPDRERRNTAPVRHAPLPDDEEELFSSDSSQYSDVSHEDYTTIKQQIKSEPVSNSLIIEYLQSLAICISDPEDQSKSSLDWSVDQENLDFQVPTSSALNTRNDGGLTLRCFTNGKWANTWPLSCYCSVEAKSVFQLNKKIEVYAQEMSQIIDMIHQRERNVRGLGPDARVHDRHRIVPLISIAQYFVYVTIAVYDSDYYHFLCTGDDQSEPFLKVKQWGAFKLTDDKQVSKLSQMIVALVLYLGDAGPHTEWQEK